MTVASEQNGFQSHLEDWIQELTKNPNPTLQNIECLSSLSKLLQQFGLFYLAEKLANHTIEFFKSKNEPDSPILIPSLLALGKINMAIKDFENAKTYLDRSLEIAINFCGEFSSELADNYYALNVFNCRTRNLELAKEYVEKCKLFKVANFDFAGEGECVNDEAHIFFLEGKDLNYLDYYNRALALFEKGSPILHPEMVNVLANIAFHLVRKGKKEEAISALERSVRVAETFLHYSHPNLKDVHERLMATYLNVGNTKAALDLKKKYFISTISRNKTEEIERAFLGYIEVINKFSSSYLEVEIEQEICHDLLNLCSNIKSATPNFIIDLLGYSKNFYVLNNKISETFVKMALNLNQKLIVGTSKEEKEMLKCFSKAVNFLCATNDRKTAPEFYKYCKFTTIKIEEDVISSIELEDYLHRLIKWSLNVSQNLFIDYNVVCKNEIPESLILKEKKEAWLNTNNGWLNFIHEDAAYTFPLVASLDYVITYLIMIGRFDDAKSIVEREKLKNNTTELSKLALDLNSRAIQLKNHLCEYKVSRKLYELSLEMDPNNALTYSNFSLLLWSCLNDQKLANQHFEKAVEINPHEGSARSNYGLFLTNSTEFRDFEAAKEHFEKGLALSPNDTSVPVAGNYIPLAICQGDLAKAWSLAIKAKELQMKRIDRLLARPLFCSAVVLELKGCNSSIPLGQLKTLFETNIFHAPWIITALLEKIDKDFPTEKAELFKAIANAIGSKKALLELETNPEWQKIEAVPLYKDWKLELSNENMVKPEGIKNIYNIIILDESGSMSSIKEQAIEVLIIPLKQLKQHSSTIFVLKNIL